MAGMLINGPAFLSGRWDQFSKDTPSAPNSEDTIEHNTDSDQPPADPQREEAASLERLEPRIKELEKMDRAVREHEQIHKAVAGQYAGEITYRFVTGPDGKRYAVGGSTPMAAPQCRRPEDIIRVMNKVRMAAMAPGDPSPEDLRVARLASARELEARAEIRRQAAQEREEIADQVLEETGLKNAPELEIKKKADGHLEIEHRHAEKSTKEDALPADAPDSPAHKADNIGEAYRMAVRIYRQQALLSNAISNHN